jgi:hypothetical protein
LLQYKTSLQRAHALKRALSEAVQFAHSLKADGDGFLVLLVLGVAMCGEVALLYLCLLSFDWSIFEVSQRPSILAVDIR